MSSMLSGKGPWLADRFDLGLADFLVVSVVFCQSGSICKGLLLRLEMNLTLVAHDEVKLLVGWVRDPTKRFCPHKM